MQSWALWALALIQAIGATLFAKGFFPLCPSAPGFAAKPHDDLVGIGTPGNEPFDRLVFVVIDALRKCVLCAPYVSGPLSRFAFVQ